MSKHRSPQVEIETSKMALFTQIPTYTSLVEAMKVYLNRYDQDTLEMFPFFINAAEKTILRNLRMPAMQKIVSYNLEDIGENDCYEPDVPTPLDSIPTIPLEPSMPICGPEFVPLPNDYLEMKYVWTMRPKSQVLSRVSFESLLFDKNNTIEEQRPSWAINSGRMYVNGIDPTSQIFMTYYADIPEISEDTQSNILLDLAPDAFLFMSVGEGFKFVMEEEKGEYWIQRGHERLQQIMKQVQDAEFSGSAMCIDTSKAFSTMF